MPHYVPVDDPMVETLLSVYEKQTGLKGHEQIIGGGTFGRLLKRGVAYGAMFPGYVNTMHQANEFTEVEDLYRAAAIYAEAIYELIKKKERQFCLFFEEENMETLEELTQAIMSDETK